MTRTAVVLFNLGGPDSKAAVQPFLFNLFSDPAIIRVPQPIRWLIAKLISTRRAPVAQEIYGQIGGRSPILPLTEQQARALEAELGPDHKVFIAMRYWHPRAGATVAEVKAWKPERIILLPLYPQFSSTTSGSSIEEWKHLAAKAGLQVPVATICCYPDEMNLISAQARLVSDALAQALERTGKAPRLLLSAHGLPEKVVRDGDPYQWQVEQTAAAVVKELKDDPRWANLDWQVSYQSRVGPMKWIGPATDDEIRRAGAEGKSLVVVPIAFVSEHSETLVELDIEYAHLAEQAGVPAYVRVPALGATPRFITGLAGLVREAPGNAARSNGLSNSRNGARICPAKFGDCPCKATL